MVYCWKCGAELQDPAAFCFKCGASIKPNVSTEGQTGFEHLSHDKTLQDHWLRRVLAFIIDSIIVGAVVSLLVLGAVVPSVFLGGGFPVLWGFWFGGIVPLVILAYFILAEAIYARTIGKQIMGLRVVRKDGKPIDLGTSFLRNISKIFWVLLLLDVVAGLAMRGETSQKYSDRYVGTVVQSSSNMRIIS